MEHVDEDRDRFAADAAAERSCTSCEPTRSGGVSCSRAPRVPCTSRSTTATTGNRDAQPADHASQRIAIMTRNVLVGTMGPWHLSATPVMRHSQGRRVAPVHSQSPSNRCAMRRKRDRQVEHQRLQWSPSSNENVQWHSRWPANRRPRRCGSARTTARRFRWAASAANRSRSSSTCFP